MSSYDRDSNPYLKLNFWEFLALSTVMLLFFPWSILVCLALYGIEETKLIVLAVIEDFANLPNPDDKKDPTVKDVLGQINDSLQAINKTMYHILNKMN